jgi:uncharacterized membrane protein
MRQAMLHVAVVAGLLAGGAVCALVSEDVYWWYTGEDRFAETLQVIFFAGALVYVVRARAVLRRQGETAFSHLYLVTALAFVFLVGEEVSWGQRFFGWATPEHFAEINRQAETTLHNIEGVHQKVGWALLFIGLYGTVLPFVVRGLEWGRRHREHLDLLVPPPRYVPYFVAMLVWRGYRNFFPLPETHQYAVVQVNEILELALAIALFLFFRGVDRDRRRRET